MCCASEQRIYKKASNGLVTSLVDILVKYWIFSCLSSMLFVASSTFLLKHLKFTIPESIITKVCSCFLGPKIVHSPDNA